MNDFKTNLNPLIPLGRLALIILMCGLLCVAVYISIRDFNRKDWKTYLLFLLILPFLIMVLRVYIKLFIKTTKKYLIRDNSIEEFNVLTSKMKTINKDEIKGFSTSVMPNGIWRFKEIIIYLKNGSIINFPEFAYLNFKNIEPTLVDKKYKYLGKEECEGNFFGGRNYKYNSNDKPL